MPHPRDGLLGDEDGMLSTTMPACTSGLRSLLRTPSYDPADLFSPRWRFMYLITSLVLAVRVGTSAASLRLFPRRMPAMAKKLAAVLSRRLGVMPAIPAPKDSSIPAAPETGDSSVPVSCTACQPPRYLATLRASALAKRGGTALPIWLNVSVSVPENRNQSGKLCRRAPRRR